MNTIYIDDIPPLTPQQLAVLAKIALTEQQTIESWGVYNLEEELQKLDVAASTKDRTADLLSNLQQ